MILEALDLRCPIEISYHIPTFERHLLGFSKNWINISKEAIRKFIGQFDFWQIEISKNHNLIIYRAMPKIYQIFCLHKLIYRFQNIHWHPLWSPYVIINILYWRQYIFYHNCIRNRLKIYVRKSRIQACERGVGIDGMSSSEARN